MKLVTTTDNGAGPKVQRVINTKALNTLSGVTLAALLFPKPSPDDIITVNDFLKHYQDGVQ
jgi:hypothetical protein